MNTRRKLLLFGKRGFDPATLFSSGEQGVWFDPRPEYLFQDVAGTVPVTADGQLVALVKDRSGNGNDMVQSNTAKQAKYHTDGTYHWIEPDGVDDFYEGVAAIPVSTQNRMTITAVDSPATPGSSAMINKYDTQPNAGEFEIFSDTNEYLPNTRGATSIYIGLNLGVISSAKVLSSYVDSGTFSARVNLGAVSSVGFSTRTPTENRYVLFARDSDIYFQGKFYGHIALFDTPKDSDKTIEYLAQKAGVTL